MLLVTDQNVDAKICPVYSFAEVMNGIQKRKPLYKRILF